MFKAFGVLASLKGLRGTWADPFGRTHERRMERQLLADYEALVARLVAELSPDNLAVAVDLASVPDMIRGFGPVKEASVPKAKAREAELLAHWPAGRAALKIAAE
jgi:indolepyruvate ferredoxin oxidoreductase